MIPGFLLGSEASTGVTLSFSICGHLILLNNLTAYASAHLHFTDINLLCKFVFSLAHICLCCVFISEEVNWAEFFKDVYRSHRAWEVVIIS